MYRFKIDRINDYKRILKYKINRRIKFRLDTYIRQSLSIIDYRCEIDVIVTSRNVPPCSRHFPPFPAIFRHFLSFLSIFYLVILRHHKVFASKTIKL